MFGVPDELVVGRRRVARPEIDVRFRRKAVKRVAGHTASDGDAREGGHGRKIRDGRGRL
jgi:hypothetical protein